MPAPEHDESNKKTAFTRGGHNGWLVHVTVSRPACSLSTKTINSALTSPFFMPLSPPARPCTLDFALRGDFWRQGCQTLVWIGIVAPVPTLLQCMPTKRGAMNPFRTASGNPSLLSATGSLSRKTGNGRNRLPAGCGPLACAAPGRPARRPVVVRFP